MTAQRATGEGTVYRRKDGRWEGAAYLPTVSGQRKRLRVYGATRQEAHSKLTLRLADGKRGIPIADASWTVGSYLDYWMSEVIPQTLRPRTTELYESVVRAARCPAGPATG